MPAVGRPATPTTAKSNLSRSNCGTYALAHHNSPDVARLIHVEDDDGHTVVHAQRDRGGIHDLKILMQDVAVADLVEELSAGDALGIGVVNAVDASGLEDDVGLDFHGAESGGGVRGEIRIAGAGSEDHDAAFFKVTHGAAADEGLGNFVHGDGALDARVHA